MRASIQSELFRGEVDDARAAAQWLAQRPEVDGDRIYAFGHSAGGGIGRLLVGNIRHMQRPHIAFYGKEDWGFEEVVAAAGVEARAAGKADMFRGERVPGDHFSSLQPSMVKFLREIEQDSP